MLNSAPTRRNLESHYRHLGIRIEHNIGGVGRWSVEITKEEIWGCLGTCDTLLEAETLIENYITDREKEAEDESA